MRQNQINNVNYLKDRRKELRNNLTPAEAALWGLLKGSALKNRKFRRQHSIGNYIVDFYCPAEHLIVELDGDVHNDPLQSFHDAERTTSLTNLGNKVIRFKNQDVFEYTQDVLDEIERNFGWRESTSPVTRNSFANSSVTSPPKNLPCTHKFFNYI
jgi:very-short-patch-repair endonuclease